MKYAIYISFLIATNCFPKKNNDSSEIKTCNVITLKVLKSKILNNPITKMPNFSCYVSKDTVLEGDEGLSWNGKAYYYEGQIAFLAETNWEDTQKIHRITILDPIVKDGELYVGQEFNNIKHLISKDIPSSPDGYLFLTYKKDNRVSIQLDISKENFKSPLFFGTTDFNNVPKTLKVESIVLM